MAVSKVVYDGSTLVDLTSDTVAASNLLSGYKAHDKAGNEVTGTVVFATVRTGSTDPAASLGSNGDLYLKLV